jgi:hypothetical protein
MVSNSSERSACHYSGGEVLSRADESKKGS